LNDGTLNVAGNYTQNAGLTDWDGTIVVGGAVNHDYGTIHFRPWSYLTVAAGLQIAAGSTFYAVGTVNGNVVNNGHLQIGDPTLGAVEINGNYTQSVIEALKLRGVEAGTGP
jgi:hypothetical protein